MTNYYIGADDTLPVFEALLYTGGGTVVDLTGSTVTFTAGNTLDDPTPLISGAASLPNGGADGLVRYTPLVPVTPSGVYLAQWTVTFPGGAVTRFPNVGWDQLIVGQGV